jgi:hypothetical protein
MTASFHSGRFGALLLAFLLSPIAGARPVAAQVGSTTDILMGVVRNDAGQPVAEAIVEATSLETEVTRQTRTDARGRYLILFPDGGGQYRLVVRAIGMSPVERLVVRHADEDRLVTDIVLTARPQQIQEVVVRGNRGPPVMPDLPTPGSIERAVTPEQVARLPLDLSDLTVLALLAPGVVQIDATDTTAAGFSVAGQRPTSNTVTLDGLTFGAASVPQEAIRNTRVITNTYDASRGQFSGAQIASVTRSGTNVPQGTFSYSLRDDDLSLENQSPDAFTTRFTQHQISGGFGRAIVRNRLFAFGSLQARLRADETQTLLRARAATLARLGTHPDSAARFAGIVGSLGLPVAAYDADNRDSDTWNALTRLDWTISNAHTATVRADWRRSVTDPSRTSPLGLPQTGGSQVATGGGGLVSVTSRFGNRIINEAKAYLSLNENRSDPFLLLPAGRVQVASVLDDGSQGVATLLFGGNAGLPSRSSTQAVELTEELSWISGGGAHRIKIGGLLNRTRTTQDATANRYGTFTFRSLQDLEAGRPASFTRTLAPVEREGTSTNGALYLADTFRSSESLQLTFGGRLEFSTAGGAAPYNPRIEELFGRRTDRLPREVHFSPRLGFTWTIGEGRGQVPTAVVRGGVGEFRSPINASLLGSAQSPTAAGLVESQLVCIGPAAPRPDWESYLNDPSTIPTTCADGRGPSVLPTRSPTVTMFAPDFGAPRSWRGSLGVQRRFGFHSLSADLSVARGVSQSGFRDLNLAATPRFTLANEAGRPVYVPASTIDPATGSVSVLGSRLHPEFGQVLSAESDLSSESVQLALGATGITRSGIIYSASWTIARSRDQSSASGFGASGFGAATTAGNPNVREWGTSDFDRRHSFVTTATLPIGGSLELTTVARLSSGAPYTPRVASDINGDGARNDRAFVFNPAAVQGDTALANGMARLLAGGSGSARQCLESQLGRVAERNSCRGPWQTSLELQANWRPNMWGLNRRLMVSLTTVNLLGGLDRLFHGPNDLRGWGQSVRPDATLLYVDGFDPVTQQFRYRVNERFGSVRNQANAFRAPFQIGLQVRYTVGPDRQRQILDAIRGRGGFPGMGGFGGGPGRGGIGLGPGGGPRGGGFANFLERFETLIPNPARQVLELRLGLRLTEDQTRRLTELGDSTAALNRRLADSTLAEIQKAGERPDPGRLFASIRPLLERGQANFVAALKAVQDILTPEQWAQVPERIKNPAEQIMRGMQGGGVEIRRPPGS